MREGEAGLSLLASSSVQHQSTSPRTLRAALCFGAGTSRGSDEMVISDAPGTSRGSDEMVISDAPSSPRLKLRVHALRSASDGPASPRALEAAIALGVDFGEAGGT